MLKLIGFVIKVTVFAIVVLLVGNMVHWKGRTISDQVRSGMAQVEHKLDQNVDLSGATRKIKGWSRDLTLDAKKGSEQSVNHPAHARARAEIKTASGAPEEGSDLIPLSERQKLRALIRDLNGSR